MLSVAVYLLLAVSFLWIMSSFVSSVVEGNLERRVDWTFETLAVAIEREPQEDDVLRVLSARILASDPRLEIYILKNSRGQILLSNYEGPTEVLEEFQILPDVVIEIESFEEDEFDEKRAFFDFSLLGISNIIPFSAATEGYLARTDYVGVYQLTVGQSLDLADETRDVSWFLTLIFIPITLLMSFLVGSMVARNIGRRISTINTTCERIRDTGDLALRIPNPQPNDEYGKLTVHINDMLEQLNKTTSRLLAVMDDIAHDLRTPLTRLKYGFEGVLNNEAHSKTDLEQTLEKGVLETDKLLGTFSTILRISQMSSQHQKSKFQPFDLNALTHSMVSLFEPLATELGHRLSFKSEDKPLMIAGDEDMLRQLITNLIENSFEHGGDNLLIQLQCHARDGATLLSISDNGKGIKFDEEEQIFEKFYRGETSRTTPGTGLGLALVKAIADLHSAKIEITHNHPGLKTTIEF